MPAALFPTGTKGDLLLLMKRAGAVSLDDAEATTGLTRPTLRQHFSVLERDGLVTRSTHKQGRGRPSLRYALTPEAEALFPSRDGHLLGRLLAFLQEHGEDDRVESFFERYWDERYLDVRQRLDRLPEDDAEGRVEALVEILREQGFMPEVRVGDGGLVIRECNCPFPEAVKRTRLPCRLEARFFERVLDERVSRVTYIPDGFPACSYEFPGPDDA